MASKYDIRRYGFHGTSHEFVSQQVPALLGRDPMHTHQITLHLGNGASAAAIRNGRAIDTSMGLTPLAGLAMGPVPVTLTRASSSTSSARRA